MFLNSNNISYVYIQAPNAFREDFELEISLIKKLGFCDKIGKISKEHMSQINFEYGIGFNTHASVDCNFLEFHSFSLLREMIYIFIKMD